MNKNNKFLLIRINPEYVEFLRNYDSKVLINSVKTNKSNRPFLGIIFNINNLDYFIPISSYKPTKTKITKIYNNYTKSGYKPLDMFFIEDKSKSNCLLAFMNLNNMIPVQENDKIYFDIQKDKDCSLLIKELDFCNDNKKEIIQSCKRIYNAVLLRQKNKLVERCCNFSLLEEKSLLWNAIQGNKDLLKDYYNNNHKRLDFDEIINIISNSETLFETKEYISVISSCKLNYKEIFEKMDFNKTLEEINNDIIEILKNQ